MDAAKIGVSVENGVATLQGPARTYFERQTAERVATHIHGIRAVANELTVNLDGTTPRGDAQSAEEVVNALAWDSAVPLNAIKTTAANGWVTLNGTADWQYQRSAAQIDPERMLGVKGVTNLITLKPKPRVDPIDVKTKIEQAFKRSAAVDSACVKVEARDGTVILKGTVKSLSERDEAERAAWSAPGVIRVDDQIRVSPF